MFCWKEHNLLPLDARGGTPFEAIEGTPMSVQEAYAEMIGKEDLTLERYQVRFLPENTEPSQLSCFEGIRILKTPGLCCYEDQATDFIIPDASTISSP